MCEFTNPWFLLLLPMAPLLVRWWWRGRHGALRYSSMGLLAGLPGGRGRMARRVGAGLRGTGLVLLVIALAGPRWPDRGSRIETEGIAIEMLVDVSGSMAEMDFDWQGKPISRLEAVKKVFHLFVAGGEGPEGQVLQGRRSADTIGLVTFATWPETTCPLTLSHGVLSRLLEAENPRTVPTESRTNIGDAIAWGLHRLDGAQTSRKVMVLLSDGEHNVAAPALTPRQAAQLAANRGVPIYAIDAGGDAKGAEMLEPNSSSPAPAAIRASGIESLQAAAQITGGQYFRARDTQTLLAVCQEIDRLERTQIQSFIYRRYYEGYPWAGLGAFVCWLIILVLEATIWQQLP